MKIIQISASYKPAYIYGGPIMSVAKLCEALVENEVEVEDQGTKSKDQGAKSKEQRVKSKEQLVKSKEQGAKSEELGLEVEVFTTTANGKVELNVSSDDPVDVDGVNVRYFKRLTKDHTHFSPALLWNLRKEILLNKEQGKKIKEQGSKTNSSSLLKNEQRTTINDQQTTSNEQRITKDEQRSTKDEQRSTNNEIIIHIHAWWNLVSVLSCLVAKWYKIPVLLSPRGMLTAYTLGNRNSISKRLIHTLLGKKLLQYCHIHATSEKEKSDIIAVIRPKSITVIPNLVELGKVRSFKSEVGSLESEVRGPMSEVQVTNNNQRKTNNEKRTTKNQTFKLIFLSRIEEKKGLELLFDALAMLKFEWSLTIAGSGNETYLNSLKQKAENLKLDKKINWVGQINKKEKFKLLERHDLLALTSYNENFANVVIESLSVGTAVLISRAVGLYDYVEANNLGWITDLEIVTIKNQLVSAFEDSEKRQRIRLTATTIIDTDFNDENLVARYVDLYKKTLSVSSI